MVPTLKSLVLLGGGHSHIFVLKSFGMKPVPGVQLTLVTRDILTPYSGMLPGYVAGHYTHDECHIDLAKLARFANARLVHETCTSLDVSTRQLGFTSRPPLKYDCLSVDIGITPDLQTVPGLDCVTPVKPIDRFVERIDALLERANNAAEALHVVVVGGGAGGVEVAFALQYRMQTDTSFCTNGTTTAGSVRTAQYAPDANTNVSSVGTAKDHKVSIFTRGNVLSSHPPKAQAIIRTLAQERGITIHEGAAVSSMSNNLLTTEKGDSVPFDECLWCTQAAPASWLEQVDLPKKDGGFLAINKFLQSAGGPAEVFAAGDVATSVTDPRPKAGVFAVRQGQPLADNLRRFLTGQPLVAFKPQSNFLGLISTGRKHAIATRGPLVFAGDWLWPMKDRIDRAFMNKFGSELPAMNKPAEARPDALQKASADATAAWEQSTMRCKGCAAKVSPQVLQKVLRSLQDTPNRSTAEQAKQDQQTVLAGQLDDAVVLQPPEAGTVSVQTVDFVNSFVDDPFVFGGIVAVHAMSDCFAMGADPAVALAVVQAEHAAPDILENNVSQMMHGAAAQFRAAGCQLAGGHSAEGAEQGLGFCITGHAKPDKLMYKDKLRADQQLILTKPIGTGVLMRGAMLGLAHGHHQRDAWSSMLQSNQAASKVMNQFGVVACTDVTGFGLLGHAYEMASASKVDLKLSMPDIRLLKGVEELVAQGIKSTATLGNSHYLQFVRNRSQLTDQHQAVLLDPQTSGGLLCGVDVEKCAELLEALRKEGCQADVVGHVLAAETSPQITVSC